IQTAEGALNETHSILNRMRDLSVQAGNETNSAEDLDAIQAELNTLTTEIDRIAQTTEFNGTKLLDGQADVTLQIGANTTTNDKLAIKIEGMGKQDLGTDDVKLSEINVKTGGTAEDIGTGTAENPE